MAQNLTLALKARDHILGTFAFCAQHFNCDFAVEIEIRRAIHDAASAASDDFSQLVPFVEDIACFYHFDYTHPVARRYLKATLRARRAKTGAKRSHQSAALVLAQYGFECKNATSRVPCEASNV